MTPRASKRASVGTTPKLRGRTSILAVTGGVAEAAAKTQRLPAVGKGPLMAQKSIWDSVRTNMREKVVAVELDIDNDDTHIQSKASTNLFRSREPKLEVKTDADRDPDADIEEDNEVLTSYTSVRATRNVLETLHVCKVIRAVNTNLQVLFARHMHRATFQLSSNSEILTAGSMGPDEGQLIVLANGMVELSVPGRDQKPVVVGRFGPGTVLGGLRALGLASSELMTATLIFDSPDPSHDQTHMKSSPSDGAVLNLPLQEITAFVISASELKQFEEEGFGPDLDQLRRRVLRDLRFKMLPRLTKLMNHNRFFRRYHPDFVKRVAGYLDLTICKPGNLIFKEQAPAKSMAILFAGAVEIYTGGNSLGSFSGCGFEFGETALLETGSMRTATVRAGAKSECLICLLHSDVFFVAFEEFPKERARLEDQVRTRLTQMTFHNDSLFSRCDAKFLHLLSNIAEVTKFAWGKNPCEKGVGEEALHILYMGQVMVDRGRGSEAPQVLNKGNMIGLEAILGLRSGAPDYTLIAGRRGCTLIRITSQLFRSAVAYFPDQAQVLFKGLQATKAVGEFQPPVMHQVEEVLDTAVGLVRRALSDDKFTKDHLASLQAWLDTEIVDPGVNILEDGRPCKSMVLLLLGEVTVERSQLIRTRISAPAYFHESAIFHLGKASKATVTAETPCIVWHLYPRGSNMRADAPAKRKTLDGFLVKKLLSEREHEFTDAAEAWKIIEAAEEERRSFQDTLQAKLRNMKVFRQFRSEILSIIANNMDVRTFHPGEVIFQKGTMGTSAYIILRGKANVEVDDKVSTLRENSTFGEMVFFGECMRTATVRAADTCVCNLVHRDIVSFAMTLFPDSVPMDLGSSATDAKGPQRGTRTKALSNSKTRDLGNARPSSGKSTSGKVAKKPPNNAFQRKMTEMMAAAKAGGGSEEEENSDNEDHAPNLEHPPELIATEEAASDEAPSHNFVVRRRMGAHDLGALEKLEESEPPTEEEVRLQGPSRPLWERCPQRSCLFDMPMPRLPPVQEELYCAPPDAEAKMQQAFRELVPAHLLRVAANRHGVRNRSARFDEDDAGLHTGASRWGAAEAGSRSVRVWPTYTSPPALGSACFLDQVPPPVTRPKTSEQHLAMLGHLHSLAASVLRVSSRPGGEAAAASPPSSPSTTSADAGDSQTKRRRRVENMKKHYMAPPIALRPPATPRPTGGKRPPPIGWGSPDTGFVFADHVLQPSLVLSRTAPTTPRALSEVTDSAVKVSSAGVVREPSAGKLAHSVSSSAALPQRALDMPHVPDAFELEQEPYHEEGTEMISEAQRDDPQARFRKSLHTMGSRHEYQCWLDNRENVTALLAERLKQHMGGSVGDFHTAEEAIVSSRNLSSSEDEEEDEDDDDGRTSSEEESEAKGSNASEITEFQVKAAEGSEGQEEREGGPPADEGGLSGGSDEGSEEALAASDLSRELQSDAVVNVDDVSADEALAPAASAHSLDAQSDAGANVADVGADEDGDVSPDCDDELARAGGADSREDVLSPDFGDEPLQVTPPPDIVAQVAADVAHFIVENVSNGPPFRSATTQIVFDAEEACATPDCVDIVAENAIQTIVEASALQRRTCSPQSDMVFEGEAGDVPGD